VMPDEKVKLEYSTNNGGSWTIIESEATGLRYMWRVPKTQSSQCLLRATTNAQPVFIGNMALIPAGTFRMGNITNHPDGYDDQKPVHEVTITKPFLMSRTEVTQQQYEAIMGVNPSRFKGDNHPVESLSLPEAKAFCNELSKLEGLETCYRGEYGSDCDFTANGYRLPTEAEWEYACRGGTETDFYTGNMSNSYCSDPALDLAGWYCGNAGDSTRAVGQKEPNSFGLYDMHGNVWEMCNDRYGYFYYQESPKVDPRGSNQVLAFVIRGGSYDDDAKWCRSAMRGTYGTKGFRFVRYY
jgi:formylglycine-generating enzyme required for sulfatase activity